MGLTFTDEDLKKLKADAVATWSCGCTMCHHLRYEPMLRKMTALLHRLEAAERYAESRVPKPFEQRDPVESPKLLEAWRKSKGEELSAGKD